MAWPALLLDLANEAGQCGAIAGRKDQASAGAGSHPSSHKANSAGGPGDHNHLVRQGFEMDAHGEAPVPRDIGAAANSFAAKGMPKRVVRRVGGITVAAEAAFRTFCGARANMATIIDERTSDRELDEPPHDLATRERLLLFVLMLVTVVVAYLSFRLVEPFLPAVTWALALAIVARPVHRWLKSKIGHGGAAAGISVFLVTVCILGPVFFVAHQVTRQALATTEWIRSEEKIAEWRERLENHPRLTPAVQWVEDNVDLAGEAQQIVGNLTTSMTSWLTGTIWLGMQLLIMLLTLFFFFRDSGPIVRTLRGLVPLSGREANKVFKSVDDTIHATVFGTVTVAMVQGRVGRDHLRAVGNTGRAPVGRDHGIFVDHSLPGRIRDLGTGGSVSGALGRLDEGDHPDGVRDAGDWIDRQLALPAAGG